MCFSEQSHLALAAITILVGIAILAAIPIAIMVAQCDDDLSRLRSEIGWHPESHKSHRQICPPPQDILSLLHSPCLYHFSRHQTLLVSLSSQPSPATDATFLPSLPCSTSPQSFPPSQNHNYHLKRRPGGRTLGQNQNHLFSKGETI